MPRGRPPKEDRDEVKKLYVSVKLTPAERAVFDRVLELRNEELRRLTGEEFKLNASELLRRLIAREAERLGVPPPSAESRLLPPPPEPEPPAPARSPSKASSAKASSAKGKPPKGRGR
ncbi:MAG TPA: hypothetical protein VFS43_21240 [Polyangiaceae bacterium]|nr:hypothetical protein [Polyangiaceae bacterium]